MSLPTMIDQKYVKAPGVKYTVDTYDLTIVREPDGVVDRLAYPEAAIWDLAARGYGMDKIVGLVQQLEGIGLVEAHSLVQTAIKRWLKLALIVETQA